MIVSRLNGHDIDEFTQGYIEAMLWASTNPGFGTCQNCGREDCLILDNGDDVLCCDQCFDFQQSNGEPPTDENYDQFDLTDESLILILKDCADFQAQFGHLLTDENCEYKGCSVSSYAGHDFYLTRHHHGCGFWDGDWEEQVGKTLTEACHKQGERYLEAGDDGKLHYR